MGKLSFREAKELASTKNLTDKAYFTPFGGGVNKKAYGINNSPWIVLSAPKSKERLIKAEIDQILSLKKNGVYTPDLGVSTTDEAIFEVQENTEKKIAFIEEKIDGFEIPRAGTAFSEDEVKKFSIQILKFIATQPTIEDAEIKRENAIKSIELLIPQIKKADVPDFQVRFDNATGKILTLDPGDPLNSENAQDKHLRWLNFWQKDLADKRYLSRLWNEQHPNNKVNSNGSSWK